VDPSSTFLIEDVNFFTDCCLWFNLGTWIWRSEVKLHESKCCSIIWARSSQTDDFFFFPDMFCH